VHDAVYSLMISVIETSNSGLTFTESTYTGEVIENKTSTQTVLIVVVLNRGKFLSEDLIVVFLSLNNKLLKLKRIYIQLTYIL